MIGIERAVDQMEIASVRENRLVRWARTMVASAQKAADHAAPVIISAQEPLEAAPVTFNNQEASISVKLARKAFKKGSQKVKKVTESLSTGSISSIVNKTRTAHTK